MNRVLSIITAVIMLAGCTQFTAAVRPEAPLELPETYALYGGSQSVSDRWWRSFGSEELNRLVEEALAGNFDIRTAWARLKQADAVARKAGADLQPKVNASTGAEESWKQSKSNSGNSQHATTEAFTAGLSAAYEVDLWGRLNALNQSEQWAFSAAEEDLKAAAVTVSAEVVNTWIDILAARRKIELLEDQIQLNESLMELQEVRFANGQASALDISQQLEALAGAKAKLPMLQLAEHQYLHALAVLLGRSGAGLLSVTQRELPDLISLPATGLPAGLLAARPDVRAAGMRLKSADWQVAAACANRLPSISLSAEAAVSSGALDLLLSNWVTTLAGSITGPVFDAGNRAAEVDRLSAAAEANLAGYAEVVAGAIQEVEDCLAVEKHQNKYIVLLKDQFRASGLAMKNARLRYMNGRDNYLDYLKAWTSVQDMERQLVDERATLIKNRVDLYRSLGGDWTETILSGGRASAASSNSTDPSGG